MAIRERNNRLYLDFYFYLPDGRKTRAFEAIGENSKRIYPRLLLIQS